MPNKMLFASKLAMLLLFTQLMGCYKLDIDDLWHKHNPDCRIEEIAYHPGFGPDTIFAKFSYDHKGNPVKIISSFTHDGRPSHFFRYDKKGRLIDYIGLYEEDGGFYDFWYQYVYDQHGRVISDSLQVFGTMINGQPQPDGLQKTGGYYQYDAYDRIKKVKRQWGFGLQTDEYIYNQAGNLEVYNQYIDTHLARSDTFYYDNKVNIRRTNRLWMFIDRNYSKNNSRPATQYNKPGLPLQYRLPENTDFDFLQSIELDHSDIKYRCK